MKNILIISPCGKRRNTIGLIGAFLSSLEGVDKNEFSISLFDTNFFESNHNPDDYLVDNYYSLEGYWCDDLIRRIPRFRVRYAYYLALRKFRQIFKIMHIDLVIVVQIPEYADALVKIAHKNGAKIVFQPFGSDMLRVSDKVKDRLMKAFEGVDGVCGYDNSGTINAAREVYHVPQQKIYIQQLYVEGVKRIVDCQGKKNREEMMALLGINYSDYNIVCGYSGRETHRHKIIIEALISLKDILPEGYQIIFPMTYGAGAHHEIVINYANELKALCDEADLKTVFLTNFMSSEQVTYLHLVTDLFIEIQTTDNGNAFMIEALYAQNQIVTGSWLKYKNFEQFGRPYYLIDSPEELPEMLRKIFMHQVEKAVVPKELLEKYTPTEDKKPHAFWESLFKTFLNS